MKQAPKGGGKATMIGFGVDIITNVCTTVGHVLTMIYTPFVPLERPQALQQKYAATLTTNTLNMHTLRIRSLRMAVVKEQKYSRNEVVAIYNNRRMRGLCVVKYLCYTP